MSKYNTEYLQNNVLVDVTRHGKPWHGRGLPDDFENFYQGPIPIEDIQRKLFSFEPLGLDIRMVVPDGTDLPNDVAERLVEQGFVIPGFKVWVRGDTLEVMGIHSDEYVGHNYNVTLIERVAEIISDDLTIASAMLLADGAEATVEISVPESIKGPDGIEYRPYLMATDSLNGSIPTTYIEAIILAICDNTRAMVLGDKSARSYRVKHTKNSEYRIMDAKTALGIVHTMEDDYNKELETLLGTKVTPKQFEKFLDNYEVGKGKLAKRPFVVPEPDIAHRPGGEAVILNKKAMTMAERNRDALIVTYNKDERVSPWKGTAFGVLQAINTHDHHESRVNEGTVRLERNVRRAATGHYEGLDRNAYNTLMSVLS